MSVIAFVPARGGSKSIPLKNIKNFAGKPLIYWVLEAANKCELIDKIVVATDSFEIINVVESFGFSKVMIYLREAKNAQDTSTTESVMLEYILKNKKLKNDDVFILIQPTSPMLSSNDLKKGILKFKSGKYNSLLSCVRTKRFFWNEDGTPINYDYYSRPRRQDFKGTLMENGAFYINTIRNIVEYKNRLYGKIGYVVMPEYSAIEIDEPMDWACAEIIKYKLLKNTNNKIKLFISDVDGVLTDAGMYYAESGDELKKFNTRDGKAFELLKNMGVKTAIITSEKTKIVEQRSKKLNVDYLFQGVLDKVKIAKKLCEKEKIDMMNVAFIGDDLNDTELLKIVGFSSTPADGVPLNKAIVDYVCNTRGGHGCVREFVEQIIGNYL